MLPRRASPEPKIDATNVVVFMERGTKPGFENSGAGVRPAMNGRLARENTGARRPKGRRDACPTTFSKQVLRRLARSLRADTFQVRGIAGTIESADRSRRPRRARRNHPQRRP